MDIVDQYYWLSYAKTSITGSADKLNDAASKISNLVAVFWGIYTATFTIGVSVKTLNEPKFVILLLILPIPLLILSYMLALWAQMPVLSLNSVDPQIPDDVKAFYNNTIAAKKMRVNAALIVFMLAGLSLTAALIKANFTQQKNDKKQISEYFC